MTTENVNHIENTADLFVKNMGNPKVAAKHLSTLMHAVADSRDSTIITKNVLQRLAKRGDDDGVNAVKRVCGSVFPGSKMLTKSKTQFTWKISGVKPDTEALERLEKAAANGLSIRATLAKQVSGDTSKPLRGFDKGVEYAKQHTAEQIKAQKDRIAKRTKELQEELRGLSSVNK